MTEEPEGGLYRNGMSPRDLAEQVLEDRFGAGRPSLPIDPFKIMREYGVTYQFREFEKLEGIYIVPEDDADIPMVGINYKRNIARQRFTAAHELCHHLKDRGNAVCPIGKAKSETERYAEEFAAELLMPRRLFLAAANEYGEKVTLDDALQIAERFGVSFRSCVYRLAYDFHVLDGEYSCLKKRISKYKPEKKKAALGIKSENIDLLRQEVDSYEFFYEIEPDIVWHRFKNDFIFNENRMEGLDVSEDVVAEIVTDLRINRQKSVYCEETHDEIIQIAGHSEMYDYVLRTKDKPSIYKLLDLNKMLFQYAPFPDEAGKTRRHNSLVLGAKFETSDWQDVASELVKLQQPVEELLRNAGKLTISEYVLEALKIHHKITQIHPFRDGNGRSSRAFLNWMLKENGLPPIYFSLADKDAYYAALESADKYGDFDELLRLTIRMLFKTIMTERKT